MSEDRHTFSEPRPIPGLELPTWDVDVFRDGVQVPILTLRIDENTLPPRKSKKKKVVWRLPDSVDQIPRFGIDEKRRLLDLFKNLKKERRKSKQKRGSAVSMDLTGLEDAKSDDDGIEPDTNNIQEQELTLKTQQISLGTRGGETVPISSINASKPHQQANGNHRSGLAPAPPGIPPQAKNGNSVDTGRVPKAPPPPPPGMDRARSAQGLSSPPPPGLTPIVPPESHAPPQIKEPPLLNQPPQSQPPPLKTQAPAPPLPPAPQVQQPPPQPAPVSAPLPSRTPVLNVPLRPPARYLKFPPGMHPDIFAQQVANLYITLLNSGQVDELLLYYTLTARKSLSLKSAKSICQTPMEMKTQHTSLVGCVFAVQGITVQQSLNSLLLIWSGICQLQGQQHGFCHTLVLVPPIVAPTTGGPAEEVHQYQIQNDALVLLTNA